MRISRKLRSAARKGFTLIELMVVVLIIGILMAMIFPGVQTMLENGRGVACRSNMQQVTRAMQSFHASYGYYPSSWSSTSPESGDDVGGWSAQARLLPHLEQGKLFKNIDFTQAYSSSIEITTADGALTKLGAMRVPVFLCPSEIRDEARLNSSNEPEHYPINYAFNLGTWFVYDPATGDGGGGSFYPDSRLKDTAFRDGINETLCMSEVKGWTPYFRNAAEDNPAIPNPLEATYLTSPTVVGLEGDFKDSSGHTEWIDGRAHQTGFTTAYPPNSRILHTEDDIEYDVDWTNWQEGKGLAGGDDTKTYAAVTARSYHPGGVNVSMMGGSVHQVSDDINPLVWRAYSTRDGDEIIPNVGRIGG